MDGQDFEKLWAADGSQATFTNAQYLQGWSFIGDSKPTRAQFNAFFNWSDVKDLWLYQNKLGKDDTAKAAAKLEAERTIKLTGAVTGEAKFDGTKNIEIKTVQKGYEASLAVNGYEKRPSGVIEQWGTVDFSSMPPEQDHQLSFPIAFPKQCLNLSLTRKVAAGSGGSGSNDGGALIVSKTRLGAVVNIAKFDPDSSATRGYEWRAIGC